MIKDLINKMSFDEIEQWLKTPEANRAEVLAKSIEQLKDLVAKYKLTKNEPPDRPEQKQPPAQWLVKVKGEDKYHPMVDMVDLGPGRGNNYLLADGRAVHQSYIEDIQMPRKTESKQANNPEIAQDPLEKVILHNNSWRPEDKDKVGTPHPENPDLEVGRLKNKKVSWFLKPALAAKHDTEFDAALQQIALNNKIPEAQRGLLSQLGQKIKADPDRHATAAGVKSPELRQRHLHFALQGSPGYKIEPSNDGGINITAPRHSTNSKTPKESHTWNFNGKDIKFLGATPISSLSKGEDTNADQKLDKTNTSGKTKNLGSPAGGKPRPKDNGAGQAGRIAQLFNHYRQSNGRVFGNGRIDLTKDLISGGKGDRRNLSGFDPKEVEMGQKVEMEHTTDPNIAREIEADHLAENPHYYSKLKESGLADELEKVNSGEMDCGFKKAIRNDYSRTGNLFGQTNRQKLQNGKFDTRRMGSDGSRNGDGKGLPTGTSEQYGVLEKELPQLKFPGLGSDTRPEQNVKQVDFSDPEKGWAGIRALSGYRRAGSNPQKNAKLVNMHNDFTNNPKSSGIYDPYKSKIAMTSTQATPATVAHEGHHKVADKMAQKYGLDKMNHLYDKMTNLIPRGHKERLISILRTNPNYNEMYSRGFIGNDPHTKYFFHQELVNLIRDIATTGDKTDTESRRNLFKKAFQNDASGFAQDFGSWEKFDNEIKKTWHKIANFAKNVKEEHLV